MFNSSQNTHSSEILSRRSLLKAGAALAAGAASGAFSQTHAQLPSPIDTITRLRDSRTPEGLAADQDYWSAVRSLYDVPNDFIHLEHGNWGMMARSVYSEYMSHTARVNEFTSYYGRNDYSEDLRAVMQKLADALGVSSDELAPVRNATEALTALIVGYNKLSAGDSVLFADLDYPSMQGAMQSLHYYRDVNIRTINLPEPATHQGILDSYENALKNDKRIKLVLLTHISHRTGLLLPVRELSEIARKYGADVILDSAHAWGQVDFSLPETGADFIGLNLHKWMGAPLGLGLLYIKRDRLADIDRHPVRGGGNQENGGIVSRTGIGTNNLAAMLSVPSALDIHQIIGARHKEHRLRHLRNLWVERVTPNPRIQVLTPQDQRLYAGITSFRVTGVTGVRENQQLASNLMQNHRIFTVYRDGLASGSCVRVTPAVFSKDEDMLKLADAIKELS